MQDAKTRGCDLVVARNPSLFDEPRRLGLAFCLGYVELTSDGGVGPGDAHHRRPEPYRLTVERTGATGPS
jgi:hypothetical protein